MITVEFSDGVVETYQDEEYARHGILEAHAEGVGVEWIEDTDGNVYSCIWDVKLQNEGK